MIFDPEKPVQLADGSTARVLCTNFKASRGRCIVAAVTTDLGFEITGYYDLNGKCGHELPGCDLINIHETRWVNVYSEEIDDGSGFHNSRESADRAANQYKQNGHGDRIACLEFQDGDGL